VSLLGEFNFDSLALSYSIQGLLFSFIPLIVHQIIIKEFKIKLLLVKHCYLVHIFLYSGPCAETLSRKIAMIMHGSILNHYYLYFIYPYEHSSFMKHEEFLQ
jgi:hypothetical protein